MYFCNFFQVGEDECFQNSGYSALAARTVGPLKSLRGLKIDWDPNETSSLAQLVMSLPIIESVDVDNFVEADITELQLLLPLDIRLESVMLHCFTGSLVASFVGACPNTP